MAELDRRGIPEAGRHQRGCRRRGRLLGPSREADSVRDAARGDHARHRGDLRLDVPGVHRRLRPARAHARRPPGQARGQSRAPDQPAASSAHAARPGSRPHLPSRPLSDRAASAAPDGSSRRSRGTRRSRSCRRRDPGRPAHGRCSRLRSGRRCPACSMDGSPQRRRRQHASTTSRSRPRRCAARPRPCSGSRRCRCSTSPTPTS